MVVRIIRLLKVGRAGQSEIFASACLERHAAVELA